MSTLYNTISSYAYNVTIFYIVSQIYISNKVIGAVFTPALALITAREPETLIVYMSVLTSGRALLGGAL